LKTEDILFMKEGKSFEILSTKHYLEPYYVFNFFKDRLRFGLAAQMN
jgi:hypothetical protein